MSESFSTRIKRLSAHASNSFKSVTKKASQILESASSELGISIASRGSSKEQLIQLVDTCFELIDYYAALSVSDSVEGDRALHTSKLREHARAIVKLLSEESEAWVRGSSHIDTMNHTTAEAELPCIATFILRESLQGFVDRALEDKPRGCLPLVLAITSALLKNVRYPLISEPTIQKPLNQLVAAAYRAEGVQVKKMGTHAVATRADLPGYLRRVEVNLAALICVLWRRLHEHPSSLESFQGVDERFVFTVSSAVPLEGRSMDILSAVVPMLGKPRVGKAAKEAIILAVGMHDACVDRLVVIETGLIEASVGRLGRSFVEAMQAMMHVPATGSGSSPIKLAPTLTETESINGNDENDNELTADGGSDGRGNRKGKCDAGDKNPKTPIMNSLTSFGASVMRFAESPLTPSPSSSADASMTSLPVEEAPTRAAALATEVFIEALQFYIALASASNRKAKGVMTSAGEQWHRLSALSPVNDKYGTRDRLYGIPDVLSGVMPSSSAPKEMNLLSPDPSGEGTDSNAMEPPAEMSSPNVNLHAEVLQAFQDMFLERVLLPALLAKRDDQVQAAQRLARIAVLHLGEHDRSRTGVGPLSEACSNCLLGSGPLMRAIMVRAGSVSRNTAVTTLQLLGALLACAPLETASGLLLEGMAGSGEESPPGSLSNSPERSGTSFLNVAPLGKVSCEPATASIKGIDDRLSEAAAEVRAFDTERELAGSVTPCRKEPVGRKHFFDSPMHEGNGGVVAAVAAPCPSTPVAVGTAGGERRLSSRDQAGEHYGDVNAEYVDAASKGILTVLSGKFTALVAYVDQADFKQEKQRQRMMSDSRDGGDGDEEGLFDNTDPYYNEDDEDRRVHGPLLNLALHKLSCFFSLKLDEQLAVTGLVERCLRLLSAMIVVAPRDEVSAGAGAVDMRSRRDLERLEAVLDIHARMMMLWREASSHLFSIPGCLAKMDALKTALRSSRPEERKQRLLAHEPPHHIKLLETGVVVRELLCEVRACVLAVCRVRSSLGDFDEARRRQAVVSVAFDDTRITMELEHEAAKAEAEAEAEAELRKREPTTQSMGLRDGDGDDVADFMSELEALESDFDKLVSGDGD